MISKFWFDIEYDIILQYRDIRIAKVKTLMSYMISVQCLDIRISKFSLQHLRFGRYWVWYAIPGAAGRTSHVTLAAQGPPTGPASWSSTHLDGLYSCVTGPFLLEISCLLLLQWPGGLPAGHGWQSWFQVIVILVIWRWSTWCQSSMLSACHWYAA